MLSRASLRCGRASGVGPLCRGTSGRATANWQAEESPRRYLGDGDLLDDSGYALAGYNPSADEVIAEFKLYVQEGAKKCEPQFDDALYAEWYRLYDVPRSDRGRPWPLQVSHDEPGLFPLAKSSGRILELVGRLEEIAEDSADKAQYEARIAKRFGIEQQLELPIPVPQ